jgi:hypothetical protein
MDISLYAYISALITLVLVATSSAFLFSYLERKNQQKRKGSWPNKMWPV